MTSPRALNLCSSSFRRCTALAADAACRAALRRSSSRSMRSDRFSSASRCTRSRSDRTSFTSELCLALNACSSTASKARASAVGSPCGSPGSASPAPRPPSAGRPAGFSRARRSTGGCSHPVQDRAGRGAGVVGSPGPEMDCRWLLYCSRYESEVDRQPATPWAASVSPALLPVSWPSHALPRLPRSSDTADRVAPESLLPAPAAPGVVLEVSSSQTRPSPSPLTADELICG
mmetsp:Transcript_17203/g.41038  ORF Transcript_17203/g.41038 Transcript_17203/m.41038 type:complete len:232 (-) Transcript_17203:124-819(-)